MGRCCWSGMDDVVLHVFVLKLFAIPAVRYSLVSVSAGVVTTLLDGGSFVWHASHCFNGSIDRESQKRLSVYGRNTPWGVHRQILFRLVYFIYGKNNNNDNDNHRDCATKSSG